MKAEDLQFIRLLQGPKQFIIPIFQRTYSWEKSHCQQLWNDIIRVGNNLESDSHFVGSVVYISQAETSAAISRWLVIDGQQRMTTMMLLLLSLMQRLKDDGLDKPISAAEVEDYYLRNPHGKDEQSYKLLLTKTDKDTLIALLDGKEPQEPISRRIVDNYGYFKDRIATANLEVVFRGIQRLMIVDVSLQRGQDNPQMIFESMNSTGKALTQADLIRNHVLMNQSHDQQTRLYNDYWRPIEADFGSESYNEQFDEFMRYFLVIHMKSYQIKRRDVYQEFKNYSRKHTVEDLLAKLKVFAGYYCRIALGKETDPDLAQAFYDIRELRADVCYPLLMNWYHDYSKKLISKAEFVEAVLLVESYVFRRAICDMPPNSLRQTFSKFSCSLNKNNYIESIKAAFLLLSSNRQFPRNDHFKQQLKSRNLYDFKRRSYWLRRFENHDRKERVQVQDYTIEHIMPQNNELNVQWKQDLGEDWQQVQEQYLHTLGNLTLTGYNSEYSDRSFQKKRDMKGGFRHSPLKLNHGLAEYESWNESTIQERAQILADKAVDIWAEPKLAEDILKDYRTKGNGEKTGSKYSIADHQYLNSGPMRELFNAFRREVLALDECVREEFLKLYVAYKAETNFVDIVPQAKRLRLSLNINFHKINDPRNLCRDVTNLGRWGNGNVEVGLDKLEDIPYVMGLVRQALEWQLGDEELMNEQ